MKKIVVSSIAKRQIHVKKVVKKERSQREALGKYHTVS